MESQAPTKDFLHDGTWWLRFIEVVGPGFAYLTVMLVFILAVVLVAKWPQLAPSLRAFLPWVKKEEEPEKPVVRPRVRPPHLDDAWLNAEDASEVIEATRKHGEMRILTKLADGEKVGVLFVGSDGTVHVMNRAAENLTGYSEWELSGVNVDILIPLSCVKLHHMHMKSYLEDRDKGLRPRMVGRLRCVNIRHKDGYEIPVKMRLTEISNGIRGFWVTIEKDDPSSREPEDK